MMGIIELAQVIALAVAGQGILGQIVGAYREEVHFLSQRIGNKDRGGSLDHNADLRILVIRDTFLVQFRHDLLAGPLIHTLFSLYRLSKGEQEIMRCLIFIPSKGISARRFGSWLKLRNLNKVNDLIEMGFVQPGNDRYISLHPMIREVAVEELKPSVQNCRTMLDSLQEISLLHGIEMPGHRQFFQMAENIIDLIRKDDVPTYLLFLENVFEYMEKYRYEPGMNAIISELERFVADGSGTNLDQAHLLECRAACEKDVAKAVQLT